MKVFSKLALIGLLFTNSSAFSAMPADGWYVGLTGGLSFTPSLNIRDFSATELFTLNDEIRRLNQQTESLYQQETTIARLTNPLVPTAIPMPQFIPFFPLTTIAASIRHSVGGDFAGQLGYRICNFRLEGELLVNYAPLNRLELGDFSFRKKRGLLRASGRTLIGAGLFNAYYDFYDEENDPTWVPYIGLGIGFAGVQSRVKITSVNPQANCALLLTGVCAPPNNFDLSLSSNNTSPVGQGIIGVSYYSSDNVAFGLDFRHLTTRRIREIGERVSVNSINFNFNYWFSEN